MDFQLNETQQMILAYGGSGLGMLEMLLFQEGLANHGIPLPGPGSGSPGARPTSPMPANPTTCW